MWYISLERLPAIMLLTYIRPKPWIFVLASENAKALRRHRFKKRIQRIRERQSVLGSKSRSEICRSVAHALISRYISRSGGLL